MAASSDDDSASGGGGEGYSSEDESACSTPFVSAPSSPARDDTSCSAAFVSSVPSFTRDPSFSAAFVSVPSFGPAHDPSFSAAAGGFCSAPASPARCGRPGKLTADKLGFDFDFDLSGCLTPAAAAMPSADELFDNGHIRPMPLASFMHCPQGRPPLYQPPPADERGRLRSRSSRRRYRSLSPFRARWLSPAPTAKSKEPAAAALRSSSSSSTASSSSWSRSYYRKWRFLKGIVLHRSKSSGSGGGGEHPPPPAPPKRSPSPSPGRGRARRSAYARLYEPRRAEPEEMWRRTFLPYRPGLPLLGCLGLGSRGYVAMYGLVAAGKARP